MRRTLLAQFARQKGKEFIREREGGPRNSRGDFLGISEAKHNASLLRLLNIPYQVIAERVGVVRDTVKNWQQEDNFRELVQEHISGFTAKVLAAIKEGKAKGNLDLFADARHFSFALRRELSDRITALIEAPDSAEEVFNAIDVLDFLFRSWGLGPLLEFDEQDRRVAFAGLIRIIRDGLVESPEGKIAGEALEVLERGIQP